MRAMVLAAGLGTRLRPLTYILPKPMIPIVNQPSISYSLSLLERFGIGEVVINLYHEAKKVEDYLTRTREFSMRIIFSEEKHLLGTAGGVKKMENYFQETFLVLSSDGVSDVDLEEVLRFHKHKQATSTVVLKEEEERFKYGIALCNEESRINQFVEKPSWGQVFSNRVNTGIYIFEPEVFSYIPKSCEYDFGKQVLPDMVKKGERIYGYVMEDYWTDVGNLEDYRKAHKDILKRKEGIDIPGRQIKENVWIGEGCRISPQAHLVPPLVIGSNCEVEEGAKVGGGSVLGDRVRIRKGASLHQCIIWNEVLVEKGAELDDCILANHVFIPPDFSMRGAVVTPRGLLGRS